MALINCLECGQKISDKAKNCPKCGWKVVAENTVDFYGNKIELKENVNNSIKENKKTSQQKTYSYKSKSSKTYKSIKPGLVEAYKLRQKDNGWGFAVAHLLPFVGIYYAISRKTITPLAYDFIPRFILIFLLGDNGLTISFFVTPVVVKCGIDTAREFAKKKLKENDISDIGLSPEFSKNKFCRNCGAAMNMNDIFCRSCGQKN